MDPHKFIHADVVDLGQMDRRTAGIYMPTLLIGKKPTGVTAQFTDGAVYYHERHFDTRHSDWLIARAFEHISAIPKTADILDIGSGSGQNVFSLLKRSHEYRIVA